MGRRLFGTDGVRGRVGVDLTAELALRLAAAATRRLSTGATPPRVLVLRDTRLSGDMFEAAICAGVTSAGGTAEVAGVLPTPAAPILMKRHGFDLAAVISASHNPAQDNGIKFFSADGFKLTDSVEAEIEKLLDDPPAPAASVGTVQWMRQAADEYSERLVERFDLDLRGWRIALDCAHGATSEVAPSIFKRLGADVVSIGVDPDGMNINDGLGSTHIDSLRAFTTESGADLGFAFDGDGDRVTAVDGDGQVVDGDELMALIALDLRDRGELAGNGVAVTIMTNFGFHAAMAAAGIGVATTRVGDRYILDELKQRGWVLGGEQSGHIINMNFNPTGDGIAAALLTLESLIGRGERLAQGSLVRRLPQTILNVKVRDRGLLETAGAVWREVEARSAKLKGRGRVVLRSSGTEPVVRVMVEAPTDDECRVVARELAGVVEDEIGGTQEPPSLTRPSHH